MFAEIEKENDWNEGKRVTEVADEQGEKFPITHLMHSPSSVQFMTSVNFSIRFFDFQILTFHPLALSPRKTIPVTLYRVSDTQLEMKRTE